MSSPESTKGDVPHFREETTRFWILRLITEVRTDGLYIRLSPIHRTFRRLAATQIDKVRVTSYAARDYGGYHWGLRRTLGENTVYRLKGRQGVEVIQSGGSRMFIGSQRPYELEAALADIT